MQITTIMQPGLPINLLNPFNFSWMMYLEATQIPNPMQKTLFLTPSSGTVLFYKKDTLSCSFTHTIGQVPYVLRRHKGDNQPGCEQSL